MTFDSGNGQRDEKTGDVVVGVQGTQPAGRRKNVTGFTRFELGFCRHQKIHKLSDAAFRLWVSAMDVARGKCGNGELNELDLDLVPRLPKSKAKRAALIQELLDNGLWETFGDHWLIHDYLDWQDNPVQIVVRRERARKRMRELRSRVRANNGTNVPANVRANVPRTLPRTFANSSPDGSHVVTPSVADGPTTTTTGYGFEKNQVGSSPQTPDLLNVSDRDLVGSARVGLAERLVQPSGPEGQPPRARKDPLAERIAFGEWFPSPAMLAFCRGKGLTDSDIDTTLIEARDKLMGRHDFEWFDTKIWRFFDVAIERKTRPRPLARTTGVGGPSQDWPTDADLSLREQIRGGAHGARIKAKLDAGQLDADLARRLIREREAARRERAAEAPGAPVSGVSNPGAPEGASGSENLLKGIVAAVGRRIP